MEVVRSIADVRSRVQGWRAGGERVSLVPTMGALHDGHLSLVRRAAADAPRTAASIFVNPTQFAPHEDFSTYPRTEERDLALLEAAGVDLVFAPPVGEIYPDGHRTQIEVRELGKILEGEFRPHFFIGVATIVTKLFNMVGPSSAVFGEKDYQQLCIIRTFVRDLDIPVDVIAGQTIREEDGLAMSSRNAYLTPDERAVAPVLHAEMTKCAKAVADGADPEGASAVAAQAIVAAGFDSVDYVAVRDAETLAAPDPARPRRVLVAARIGRTRLIDNMAV